MACRTSAASIADAAGQEQVIKDEQIRRNPVLEQLGALCSAGQRVTGELVVGLQVTHVIALQ